MTVMLAVLLLLRQRLACNTRFGRTFASGVGSQHPPEVRRRPYSNQLVYAAVADCSMAPEGIR